jgi:hypothetical protein
MNLRRGTAHAEPFDFTQDMLVEARSGVFQHPANLVVVLLEKTRKKK